MEFRKHENNIPKIEKAAVRSRLCGMASTRNRPKQDEWTHQSASVCLASMHRRGDNDRREQTSVKWSRLAKRGDNDRREQTSVKWSRLAKRGEKGFVYTLEVLIAISIMLASLVFIFRSPPPQPELGMSIIKTQGMDALFFLDEKGTLRKLAFDSNETQLKAELKSYLSKNIGLEAQMCALSCSTANVPSDKTVIALDYYVSGYKENYVGRKVKLWLWRES